MKTPPFSLFPLRALDDAPTARCEFDTSCKTLYHDYSLPTSPWFTTVMASNQRPHQPHANKGSLAFILDQAPGSGSGSDTESDDQLPATPSSSRSTANAKRRRASLSKVREPPTSPDAKKGSKYCIVDGCTSRAKHARKCWRHGGSVKCKVPECINRAKSKGVCWSHGGGTICSHADCDTIAVSHGFCWAHGGGKRCQIDGCSRPAYERTDNFCTTHHKQRLRAAQKQL